MKFFITLLLFATTALVYGQQNPASQVAETIARKMKDSLSLTSAEKEQLYSINMQLHNGKMTIRQQYGGSDSLRFHLQQVENTRDSLYRMVLNEEKYLLYKQKKATLISSN
jgi:hypothetical protein